MTDRNALLSGQQPSRNSFGPLTAEQNALLQRDKIDESLGPFDFMPGPFTWGGAALGAVGTASLLRDAYRYGAGIVPNVGQRMRAVAKDIPFSSLPILGGAAAGYVADKKDLVSERMERERQMMMGNPRDAEGQLGGFYGDGRR